MGGALCYEKFADYMAYAVTILAGGQCSGESLPGTSNTVRVNICS